MWEFSDLVIYEVLNFILLCLLEEVNQNNNLGINYSYLMILKIYIYFNVFFEIKRLLIND